jgi:type I site-specific restriction endonuclease
MGRSKTNKRKLHHHEQQQKKQPKHGGKSKRQRKVRFWILDCKDTTPLRNADVDKGQVEEEPETAHVELLVTRVELSDDYEHVIQVADPSANVAGDAVLRGNGQVATPLAEQDTNPEASTTITFENHTAPILTLQSPGLPSSSSVAPVDEKVQESDDTENSKSITVAVRKATSAKRPMQKVGYRYFLLVAHFSVLSSIHPSLTVPS